MARYQAIVQHADAQGNVVLSTDAPYQVITLSDVVAEDIDWFGARIGKWVGFDFSDVDQPSGEPVGESSQTSPEQPVVADQGPELEQHPGAPDGGTAPEGETPAPEPEGETPAPEPEGETPAPEGETPAPEGETPTPA